MHINRLMAAVLFIAMALTGGHLLGASGAWTNPVGGLWSDGGNWSGGTIADGSGSLANFGTIDLGADVVVTLDSSRTIGTLQFGDTAPSHNWTLASSGGAILTLDGTSIAVNNQAATVTAQLAGATDVNLTGAGKLLLNANNSAWRGLRSVGSGSILQLLNGNAMGGTAMHSDVWNGGTLELAGGITVPRTVFFQGTGVGGIGALRNVGGDNVFAGRANIGGSPSANFTVDAGTLTLNQGVQTWPDTNRGLVKEGAGTLIFLGNDPNYAAGTTISAGALQVGNGGTSGSLPASGNVVNNASLVFNRSDSLTVANSISGSGGLVKQGAGTLILTGNNTYLGTTTVSGGTLQIGSNGTTGTLGAGTVTNNGTIVFDRTNTYTYAGTINGGTVYVQRGGTLELASGASLTLGYLGLGNNGANNGTGTLLVQDGASLSTGGIALGNPGGVPGTINQLGGTVTYTGAADSFRIGHWPSETSTYNLSGGQLNVNSGNVRIGWDGNGILNVNGGTLNGSGIGLVLGRNGSGTLNVSSGTVNVGSVNVGAGGTGNQVNVSGTGTLNVGSLLLGEANGRNGVVDQTGGAVNVSSGLRVGHWPSQTSTYAISNGTFSMPSGVAYIGWDGNGILNVSGGVFAVNNLKLGGGDGSRAGTGTLNLTGGRLEIGAGGLTYRGTYDTENLGGGTLASTASWSSGAYLQFTGTNGNTTLDTLANTMTLSGNLSGAGGFTKVGTGTLVLSGTNTFNGPVTISNGVVQVTSASGLGGTAGATTVNGGTLDLRAGIPAGEALYLAGTGAAAGMGALGNGGAAGFGIDSPVSLTANTSVGGPNYLALSGPLYGSAYTLTKVGTGMIVLNSNSTTVGPIVVNQGILTAQQNGALGDTVYNTTVNSGATLQIWGASGLTLAENVVLNAATLQSANAAHTLTGSVTLGGNSTAQTDTPLTLSGNVTGAYTLTKTGGSTLTLGGSNNSLANLVVNGGGSSTVTLAGGTVTTVTGGINVGQSSQGKLIVEPGASLSTSSLMLGQASSIVGNVDHNGGSVTVSGGMRVGHYPSNTSTYNLSSGSLTLTGSSSTNPYFTSGTSEVAGTVYLGVDGTGIFNHSGGNVSAQGLVLDNRGATSGVDTYTMTGGTLTLGRWGIQGNASSLQVNLSGGTILASANWTSSLPMTLNTTNGNVTFDTTGGAIGLSGVLSGAGGLKKAGSNTLTLSNIETYQGSTQVLGGTLALSAASNNNIASSAAIDIRGGASLNVAGLTAGTLALAPGQTLTGDGTVTGNLNVAGGSTVGAGASPGHLVVSGVYTQSALGRLYAEIGGYGQGVGYDWIQVGGTATLAPGSIIDVDWYGNFIGHGPFDILTAAGGFINTDLSTVTFLFDGASYGEHAWQRTIVAVPELGPTTQALRLELVPEPATGLLLMLGVPAAIARIRRRMRKN